MRDESEPAAAHFTAAADAFAAVARAELAAQDLLETLAAGGTGTDDQRLGHLLAAAHTVTQATTAATRALAVAIDAKDAVVMAAAADALAARRTEARLTHELLHDRLTGLPNRQLLDDRLTQALGRAKRSGTFVAVLFLDLDDFKRVNDSLGHALGDQLLIGVARRLEEGLRDTDTCARVGGDEFVIVLEDLGHPSEGSMLVKRLRAALAAGVAVGNRTMPVYASVGLAVSSAGSLPAELLDEADSAMYQVKGNYARGDRRRPTASNEEAPDRTAHSGAVPDTPTHTQRRADRL